MSKVIAGVILNPKPGTSMAFTDEGTLVAHPDEPPRLVLPDGRVVDFTADALKETSVPGVMVFAQRFFFSKWEDKAD